MSKEIFEKRLFEEYLEEREASVATVRKYMTDIRTFFSFLGNKKITKKTLLEYKEWLQSHYAVSSSNSMIVALNQYLNCIGCGKWRIRRIKSQGMGEEELEKQMNEEEFYRLLQTARNLKLDQMVMIMETIGSTGIRISELQFFTVKSVMEGIVKIRNKGKHRRVVIPETLRKKLLYYIGRKRILKGSVFVTKTGNVKDRSNIWRELKRIATLAGVREEKVFPHNFRHFFAQNFYRITRNLVQLADILGHSNIEVTRRYAADGISEWKKSMEKLSFLLE